MMPPSAPSRAPGRTWTEITSFNAFTLETLLMSLHEVNRDIREMRMYHISLLCLNLFLASGFIVIRYMALQPTWFHLEMFCPVFLAYLDNTTLLTAVSYCRYSTIYIYIPKMYFCCMTHLCAKLM